MMYIVVVEGSNCLVLAPDVADSDGVRRTERLGFFTTRCVEAANDSEAADLAVESAVEELTRNNYLQNPESDPPAFRIESLRRKRLLERSPLNRGFTFYPEKDLPVRHGG